MSENIKYEFLGIVLCQMDGCKGKAYVSLELETRYLTIYCPSCGWCGLPWPERAGFAIVFKERVVE
jgi:hypothetical protein